MSHFVHTPPKLLLDAMIWYELAERLRLQGFDVVHVKDVHLINEPDDEKILIFASEESRALLTFNVIDFAQLAINWEQVEKIHAGIILSNELKDKGELLRRTQKLLESVMADELFNGIRWLSNFR